MSASALHTLQSLSLRVSGRDHDIEGSEGTSTGGGSNTVGENLLTDLLEVGVGEDEADVACNVLVPGAHNRT
jgi:hypothetical protein